ncbi:MAG: BatA domain-containing protein [Cytophagales bacterium]|nr:BatA domain-containing protein [Cytophagales bacterium]
MQFTFPAVLFGLSAIAIPIFIHLFDLQVPQKIWFTRVSFLLQIEEKTSKSRNIKHWLILLFRILAVIFLVLAFAQPYIVNKDTPIPKSQLGIYIDNSYSLQYEDKNEALKQAGENAKYIIRNIPDGTSACYVNNDGLNKPFWALNKTKLLESIEELYYSTSSVAAPKIVNHFNKYFSNASATPTIYWISDFQKNNYLPSIKTIFSDTTNRYVLLPIVINNTSNVYIDTVWVKNQFIKSDEPNELMVRVANTGNEEIQTNLKFVINDVLMASSNIKIQALSFKDHLFSFIPNHTNTYKAALELTDPNYIFDNKYYFMLKAMPEIQIMLNNTHMSSYFEKIYKHETTFKPVVNDLGASTNVSLKKYSLIVAEQIDKLSKSEQEILHEYVINGGTILVTPSASPNASQLPPYMQIAEINLDKEQTTYKIEFPGMNNPLFENVFEKYDPNTDMPWAMSVVRPANVTQILLKNIMNEAVLYKTAMGKGNIYVWAMPMENNFTNIMLHALFIPAMYKIAQKSARKSENLHYTIGQSNVEIPISNLQKESIIRLKKDTYQYILNHRKKEVSIIADMPDNIPEAGYYDLYINDSLFSSIALNMDKNESKMKYYNIEEIKKLTANMKNVQIMQTNSILNSTSATTAKNITFWKQCIIIALLCLLCEILVIRFWK